MNGFTKPVLNNYTMKEVLIFLSVSSFYLAAPAQDLTLIHREIAVTDVKVDSWAATLNDDKSFYEATFEDFTKNEFGTKSKNNGKDEELLEKVSIPQVTDKRGDLRLTFFVEGTQTKLGLSLMLGYDVWINPNDYLEEMEKLKHLARDYLRFHYTEYYNSIIDKDMDLINSHKKTIEKSKKSIGNMSSQIAKNETKLSNETSASRRSNLEKKNQENSGDIARLEEEIPLLEGKIDSLDEHILQMKEQLKYVEEQYFSSE